jgi:hypothetical protein
MALITNGQDIQNAIYGVLKQDGYLIFLGSGGQEIARVKDEAGGEGLPYKLNLTDSGRINLKDASGSILSYVQQLSTSEQTAVRELIANPPSASSPLIHSECFPVKYSGGVWKAASALPSLYTYNYNIVSGGFSLSIESSISDSANIGLKISADPYHTIVADKVYFITTTLTKINSAEGGQVGSSSTVHTSNGGNTVNRWVFKKYADSPFFYSKIGGITTTEQGWDAVGIIVEIYGEPLEAV